MPVSTTVKLPTVALKQLLWARHNQDDARTTSNKDWLSFVVESGRFREQHSLSSDHGVTEIRETFPKPKSHITTIDICINTSVLLGTLSMPLTPATRRVVSLFVFQLNVFVTLTAMTCCDYIKIFNC